MRIEITHNETGDGEGFEARGASLFYSYDALLSSLDIHKPQKQKTSSLLYRVDMKMLPPESTPVFLANTTEKAAQIFALAYSDQNSIDICKTIHRTRLTPILSTVVTTAKLACELKNDRFTTFTDFFAQHYDINKLQIDKIQSKIAKDNFYRASIQSVHSNTASVAAADIHTLLQALSERILRDVVVFEYDGEKRKSAQTLLQISARLAAIARIIDENYTPEAKIREPITGPYKRDQG
ncbi:MAG: hypothetical protein KDI13_05500 [Alphaproteobacteria bacterium]|nr:hypothetical protein [Alphaproteobacteria bacterium]